MSTQKAKFELFTRLQNLGFTYEEAVALRRIEMTLQRWGEAECGDSNEYCSTAIERDEATGKPFRVVHLHHVDKPRRHPIADREAGALRRLEKIVNARNTRMHGPLTPTVRANAWDYVLSYYQGDPRGCTLYILTREQLMDKTTGQLLPIEQYYTRGLAVCA